jgi:flagellar L-ring protein precursor FlgH
VFAGALVCLPSLAAAQQPKSYDDLWARYQAAARQPVAAPPLWMTDLMSDPVARRMNDIVTVRVLESVSAAGSADSRTGKASDANVTFPPGKITDALGHILPTSAETKFNGSGTTSRTTELAAIMSARVVEVLPNGDLVVEGVRELDINGDRTLIVLTGVIRSIDILPGNVIPSTRIGQLRIRSLSQGLIKDSLSPGWLIRILNKIF